MTLQELGSIGELVGAIATVAMLAYLAIQVRQNSHQLQEATKIAKLNAYDRTVEAFARYRGLLAESKNAELYTSGLASYENLTQAEKVRFGAIIEEYFFAYSGTWERILNDSYNSVTWASQAKFASSLLLTEGGAEWWAVRKNIFQQGFIDEIERVRDAT
jgi:IS1 family transposase